MEGANSTVPGQGCVTVVMYGQNPYQWGRLSKGECVPSHSFFPAQPLRVCDCKMPPSTQVCRVPSHPWGVTDPAPRPWNYPGLLSGGVHC